MFNMEIIKQDSQRVYDLMKQKCRYTFKEPEQAVSLGSTELLSGTYRIATGRKAGIRKRRDRDLLCTDMNKRKPLHV